MVMLGGVLLVSGHARSACSAPPARSSASPALAAIWLEPYRRARLFAFLDPWSDPQNSGFQSVQALIGMGSGGVFGEGLGQGISKVFYLPEAHTDMIFAIVGEELGLLGTTLVIAGFAVFAYTGMRIALRCKDPFGKRLAAALTTLVCGQAADQPRRRDGRRPADRDPAAVRVLRRLEPGRAARVGGRPP